MRSAIVTLVALGTLALGLSMPAPGNARGDDADASGGGASTGGASAGHVGRLDVALAPAEITVGDRVEARITLVWMGQEPAAEPRFPAWRETWGDAEVLAVGEVDALTDQTARRIYRQTLTLTAFDTGEIRLPRISVAVPLQAETVEITHGGEQRFEVKSVLPAEPGEGGAAPEPLEARDAAPPVPLPAGARFPAAAGGLGALCLLMAWLLRRRLALGGAANTEPAVLEPLAELLQRLRRLDPEAGEPAHTGLSFGLRGFLSRSLAFPALESTTSEIQRRLRQTPVPPAVAQEAVRLLRDCDQVKFAGARVGSAQTSSRLAETGELAHEIDRRLRPPEPVVETAG
ncbi:MAG: hypothetical protein GY719_26740 [bacterium]|nr:hypothetical protein [bacterium]